MQNALLRLGQSIADAAVSGLTDLVEATVSITEVTTLVDSAALEEHVVAGIVVADAGSVDGAAGRSLLLLSTADARALAHDTGDHPARPAAAVEPAGEEPSHEDADAGDVEDDASEPAPDVDDPDTAAAEADTAVAEADAEPSAAEPETSDAETVPRATLDVVVSVADAVNAAAGNALSLLLGQATRYEPAQAAVVEDPRFVVRPGPVQAVCVILHVGEVAVRLIHFAPNALVMRAARAYEDLAQDLAHIAPGTAAPGPSEQTLSGIRLRVWAELGRTELALSDALSLPLGTVVELDHEADAPVDLVVNGMRFGTGRLIVTDEGEWALALDEVGAVSLP